jgi:hypothetical protein
LPAVALRGTCPAKARKAATRRKVQSVCGRSEPSDSLRHRAQQGHDRPPQGVFVSPDSDYINLRMDVEAVHKSLQHPGQKSVSQIEISQQQRYIQSLGIIVKIKAHDAGLVPQRKPPEQELLLVEEGLLQVQISGANGRLGIREMDRSVRLDQIFQDDARMEAVYKGAPVRRIEP